MGIMEIMEKKKEATISGFGSRVADKFEGDRCCIGIMYG